MPRIRRCLGVALFALVPLTAEAGPILLNGSFELGPDPFSNHDIGIPAGSTAITGWTVLGGGVDLLEDPWDVSDGLRAIDLDLNSPGGIEQTFATLAGVSYWLSFDLSGNPEGGTALKPLRVSVGNVAQELAYTVTGTTLDDLTWLTVGLTFEAQSDWTTLRFESLSAGGSYGALVDNVSVTAVPEPSTLLLVSAGAAILGTRRRWRNRWVVTRRCLRHPPVTVAP